MTSHRDPQLERFTRSIDLVDYAKRAGYEPRPENVGQGLTVLDHPQGDRVVVARSARGPWIYASIPDYRPRAPDESPEIALARLRGCIARAKDKGTLVEFVRSRPWVARSIEDSVEQAFAPERRLDGDAARRAPRQQIERSPADAAADLGRRRYDWTPPPEGVETEVDRRLRRWREAEAALDRHKRIVREGPDRGPSAPPPAAPAHGVDSIASRGPAPPRRDATGRADRPELERRRYDWTPPPTGADAIARGARSRSRGRDR